MFGPQQLRRAGQAALWAVVCLGAACTSVRPPAAGLEPPPIVNPAPSAEQTKTLSLSADQDRHAAALARYSAAVSTELRAGLEAALPEYEAALALDPQNAALAVRLAQIAIGRKDTDGAIKRLEAATQANPKSADPWLWLGLTYRSTEQPDKALKSLEQALAVNPQHADSLRALVETRLQADQTNEVVALLNRAWQQNATDAGYWMKLGDLFTAVAQQKPALAPQLDSARIRKAYEKARELAPRDPDVLLRVAEVALNANDFAAAAEVYQRLVTLRPDMPLLRERLALAYLRADQKEKALSVFKEMIRRAPTRFESYNTVASLQEELDKDDDAIASYQQSLVLNPNQLDVYLSLAGLELKRKKPAEALARLAEAKTKFPTAMQVPYMTGLVYSEQREHARAVAAFADAESLIQEGETKPTSGFYFSYGAACERAGDIDKAAKLFEKSLELDPNNHAAQNYLGYMWADKGINLERAHELIKKAVTGQPDSGAYLDSLGWVLFKLGRTEEALPHLKRAAELVKDDATVFDHLADVLLKLGKRDEAIQYLKRAAEIDPKNKGYSDKLQKLAPQP